ncbi:putative outer membrane usher protein LpfC [Trichinella pseudospiralis]
MKAALVILLKSNFTTIDIKKENHQKRYDAMEVMSRKNVIRYFNSTSYSVGAVALISCLVGDAAKLPPLSPAAAVAEHAYSFFRKACFYLGGVSTKKKAFPPAFQISNRDFYVSLQGKVSV